MLATDKADALASIDAAAAARLLPSVAIEIGLVHLLKVQEAQAWQAARRGRPHCDPPPLGDYPLLAAELGITGETMAEIVEVVLAKHDAFRGYVAEVEAMRLVARKAIRASITMQDINSVLAALAWPDPAAVA